MGGNLIYQHIYDSGTLNERFVPMVFSANDMRFVPTPMRGATAFVLDSKDGYERLYARLTRQGRVPKPPLGERRAALPIRTVKTDPSMYITGPIHLELWDRARWSGTIFMWAADGPPVLGLAFQDESAGRRIFEDWRSRYGNQDVYEELRIANHRRRLNGQPPGYSNSYRTNRMLLFDDFARKGLTPTCPREDHSDSEDDAIAKFREPVAVQTALHKFRRYILAPGVVAATEDSSRSTSPSKSAHSSAARPRHRDE